MARKRKNVPFTVERASIGCMARPNEPWALKEREPNGRYRRETAQEIRSVAVNARLRMGVPFNDVLDPLAGWAFGRMKLQKVVSADQYDAGLRWEAVVGREAKRLGVPRPFPKSPSATLLARSSGILDEDMTPEWCDRVRREYDDVYCAFNDTRDGRGMLRAMKAIILMDERGSIGQLRCGLNIIMKLWG